MLRYLTAGESHGKSLAGIIEGLPAGLTVSREMIDRDLARRQEGYGRGGRMAIEKDHVEILSGIRGGITLGSPLAYLIHNRDYENWKEGMDPFEGDLAYKQVFHPRPGHADLPGALKYGFTDVRAVLERSSARETAVRVAAGSIARQLLSLFGIEAASHVVRIGSVMLNNDHKVTFDSLLSADTSPVRCINETTAQEMMKAIDQASAEGDSLGGVVEVRVKGIPVGLGSHVQWDRKLDARLAYALMSIQAIKGVEIGDGFQSAKKPGSQVHDEIFYDENHGFYRKTNHAGGIEGGISNGEEVIIRCVMKPIPTLMKSLKTVDMRSHLPYDAAKERSDTCAVPAAAVVAEGTALFVIAQAFMETFGHDSLEEMKRCWKPSK
ncbi:MAG: chorismate synthase [Bacillota bacterium]|nr:chorismate synthase [Bacillota bacterium]MDW7677329.1 chorismate synthase [Bacillota bacterium]